MTSLLLLICFLQIYLLLSSNADCSYSGYKLVRFSGFGKEQTEALEEIEADIWGTDEDVHVALVQLNPDQYNWVLENPKLFSNFTLVQENLQSVLDEEAQRIEHAGITTKNHATPLSWFGEFHKYEEIKTWYQILERNDENKLVKLQRSIGQSHEKRDIFAVHITEPPANGARKIEKSKVWIQCLIHAREWISGSVCQYIAHALVTEYKAGNKSVRSLLKESEIVMIPIVNPDGYVFSWTSNRLWRKNRRGTGTDLNRNFADHWGTSGGAKSPASDLYSGPAPVSEPETKAIQGYFSHVNKNKKIVAALDFHSFSQLVLRPVGWTHRASQHEEYLKYASNFMSQAMRSAGHSNRQYQVKRSSELYLNAGSATDWFYVQGARYSVAVELPPSLALGDSSGFLLPANEILGVCKEAFGGFMSFTDFALHNPLN